MHFAGNPTSKDEKLAKQEWISSSPNRSAVTRSSSFRLISVSNSMLHELVQLARKVDWARFEAGFGSPHGLRHMPEPTPAPPTLRLTMTFSGKTF
jgi:hypothetical protein